MLLVELLNSFGDEIFVEIPSVDVGINSQNLLGYFQDGAVFIRLQEIFLFLSFGATHAEITIAVVAVVVDFLMVNEILKEFLVLLLYFAKP